MSANLSAIFYLVSGVLFILALRGLSSTETSRQGNFLGILGMVCVLDSGVLFVTLVGFFVVVAAYCGSGILASALTSHPLASARLAFMFNVGLFMIHWLRFFFRPGDLELLWVEYLSAVHHIGDELTQGILDIRVFVWWGSFTLLTLFLSARVLERRRW